MSTEQFDEVDRLLIAVQVLLQSATRVSPPYPQATYTTVNSIALAELRGAAREVWENR